MSPCMNTVAMALFPDFLLLDMAGPLEVFSDRQPLPAGGGSTIGS